MLKLIRALSEYNGPTYDGAVMARAVIKASVLENGDYSTRPVKWRRRAWALSRLIKKAQLR